MAGEPAIELEARLADIQENLSLWSQLPDHDKKQFKALVDQKIYALAHYARDKDTKKSSFLKRFLELRRNIKIAGFDLNFVDTLISEEVKRTMLEAGLPYEEASNSVQYTPDRQFSVKIGFCEGFGLAEAYMKKANCYITYDSDARMHKVVNRDNKDVILTLLVDNAGDTYYAESSNRVLIQNRCMLGLEMSTTEEAQDFIEAFKRQTNKAFPAQSTQYVNTLYVSYLR